MLIQYYLDGIMFPCKTHFLMQISLHPPPHQYGCFDLRHSSTSN